jgi:hypothetical protein
VASTLKWDREFESPFLQRGVRCELDPTASATCLLWANAALAIAQQRARSNGHAQISRHPTSSWAPSVRNATPKSPVQPQTSLDDEVGQSCGKERMDA